ncbi:MAG: hypothetical protein JXR83_17160 [Deltaproteobacteria bacterium]|nr:hypothetical protein [Deltaproteobacteria bacterium]
MDAARALGLLVCCCSTLGCVRGGFDQPDRTSMPFDAARPDAERTEVGARDTGTARADAADAGMPDVDTADVDTADASAADAAGADAVVADAAVADTAVADGAGAVYEIDLDFTGADVGGVLDCNGVDTGFALVLPSPNAVCDDSDPACDDGRFPFNPLALSYYIPGNLLVDTAQQMLVITTTDGDNILGIDDQDNALVREFDASRPFVLWTRIIAPPLLADWPDADFEGGGVLWALDASNYLKVVVAHNCDNIGGCCIGIQFGSELGGSWNGGAVATNPELAVTPGFSTLDLFLAGDQVTTSDSRVATASYAIDEGNAILIESRSDIPAALFAASGIYGGILATHTPYTPPDGGTALRVSFGFFRLERP